MFNLWGKNLLDRPVAMTLTEVIASITRSLAAGCVELGVEGGSILWDIREPEATP